MSCCNCGLIFSTRDVSLPFILSCKHSACFRCIKKNAVNGFLECRFCEAKCDLPKINDSNNVGDVLPVNLYLVSQIFANDLCLNRKIKENNQQYRKSITNKKHKQTHNKCAECFIQNADCYCKQCNSIFCQKCFSNIHSFHSFRKHLKIPIEHIDYFYKFCQRHPEMSASYYCESCSLSVCANCLVPGEDSCKDHVVVTNAIASEEFDELSKRINKDKVHLGIILSHLDKNKNKVQAEHNNFEESLSFRKLRNKITDSFLKAYNVLQIAEFNLVRQLSSYSNSSISDILTTLTENEENLNKLLSIINVCFEPEYKDMINFKDLIEKIEEAYELPCQLQNNTEKSLDPTLQVNEDVLNVIEGYCKLSVSDSHSLKLSPISIIDISPEMKSENDIKEDMVEKIDSSIEPKNIMKTNKNSFEEHVLPKKLNLKSLITKKVPKPNDKPVMNKSTNSSLNTSIMQHLIKDGKPKKTNTPNSENKRASLFSELNEGSNHNVIVTHVISPHDFYVQHVGAEPYLKKMSRKMMYSKLPYIKDPTTIQLGQLVAYHDKEKDYCYRAIINGLMKNNGSECVEVNLLDFGYNKTVSIFSLKIIDNHLKEIPPVKMHCILANCNPISGKWEDDTVMFMRQIFESCKYCIVFVKKIINFSYEVNLTICPIKPEYALYSLRDALLFLGYAHIGDPKNEINRMCKTFIKSGLTNVNFDKSNLDSDDEVFIVHVVSPEEFYLRKVNDDKSFNELSDLLNSLYKIDDETGLIVIPQIGCVIACYTEDLKWCRGRIESVIDKETIHVFLLDYGKTTVISLNMMRALLDCFYKTKLMAVRCFLNGIKPISDNWHSDATLVLIEISQNWTPSIVQVIVNNSSRLYGVELYSCLDSKMTLINKHFVEKKLASYISITSQDDSKKSAKINKCLKKTEEKSTLATNNKNSLFFNKIPVEILSAINPSIIYVSLESQEKELTKLSKEMQICYKDTQMPDLDWKNGDECAAFCPKTSKWCRGVIENIENETYQIYFKDTSELEKIPVKNLRKLKKQFSSVEDGAIKCSLKGILPAVGNKWPNLSCEYLREVISTSEKFLIEKESEIESGCFSVQLWAFCVTPGTALEPRTTEWKRVNELMVEKGLAIRESTILQSTPNDEKISICDIPSDNIDGNTNVSDMKLSPSINNLTSLSQNDEKESVGDIPSDNDIKTNVSDLKSSPSIKNLTYQNDEIDKAMELLTSDTPLLTSDIKAWKPPILPTKDFTGIPTFIDNDFNIYIIDITNNSSSLENVNQLIAENYDNSAPQPQDMFWHEGQPCIALFHLDSKYYRGEILEILENNNVSVRFVDYGNEEICLASSLRKNLILTDVPIQVNKCRIVGVKPVGETWKEETIDIIYRTILEKECSINILGTNRDNDILYIKLNIPGALDLANLMIMMKLADYDDYPEMVELFPSASEECGNIDPVDDPDIIFESEIDEKNLDILNTSEDNMLF